jgi:3-oxoacyl-[acyl-carrier protein] reductase
MLYGKIALVTGASRGIGKAIIELFAQHGAVVYANARNIGCLDNYADELKSKYNTEVVPLYFDVIEGNSVKAAFMRIKKEHGRLDILVNNAGLMKYALIGMISSDMIREVFEVNVFAVANMIQIASKFMIKQKSGSIVNMSSIVGITGGKGQLAYSAAKGAIIAMTKSAAKELASENIRVNAIAPGMIDTDLFRSIGDERIADSFKAIGMGRLGTPEDVAKVCTFLASDLSEYVTGQVIGVDGAALI